MADRQQGVPLDSGPVVQRASDLERRPGVSHAAAEEGVSTVPSALLGVQQTAGNRVAAQLVQRHLRVQRLKATGSSPVTQGIQISESVGRGGRNLPDDVQAVAGGLEASGYAVGEGPEAVADAIERFQSGVVGLRTPDGRVDPGGPTLTALRENVTKATARADTQLWEDEFRLGRKYVEAGDYSNAAVIFKKIYDDPKFHVEGWSGTVLNLAECQRRLGNFDLAISYAQEMLDSGDVGPEARQAALDIIKSSREKIPD